MSWEDHVEDRNESAQLKEVISGLEYELEESHGWIIHGRQVIEELLKLVDGLSDPAIEDAKDFLKNTIEEEKVWKQ